MLLERWAGSRHIVGRHKHMIDEQQWNNEVRHIDSTQPQSFRCGHRASLFMISWWEIWRHDVIKDRYECRCYVGAIDDRRYADPPTLALAHADKLTLIIYSWILQTRRCTEFESQYQLTDKQNNLSIGWWDTLAAQLFHWCSANMNVCAVLIGSHCVQNSIVRSPDWQGWPLKLLQSSGKQPMKA